MGGLGFFILLGAALVLWIQYLIAKEFYGIAVAKGYNQRKYLWLPFFLGLIGFLLVVALPDRSKQIQVQVQVPAQPTKQDELPDL